MPSADPRDLRALAARNQALAAKRHRLSGREALRRGLLRAYATLATTLPAGIPIPRALLREVWPGSYKAEPDKTLIIRPDHLGDMLLSMPAIQALGRKLPPEKLIGLTGAWSAEALAAYPEVGLVLTIPFPGFTRGSRAAGGSMLTPYRMAWEWAQKIRALHVETAIILRPDHWWGALLAFWAGIPRRVGYDQPDVAPFLTERVAYAPHAKAHSAIQSLRLVEHLTGPIPSDEARLHFPILDVDRAYIAERLSDLFATPKPYVVIHPGAGAALKQWGVERWAFVADRLIERLDAAVIFTGSDREHAQVFEIINRMSLGESAYSLVGETALGQLAALYSEARVVLGPDTGPLHLAVASGAPTVHLYGPADPTLFGPFLGPHGDPARNLVVTSGIACRPCRILDWGDDDPANHPCIRDIEPIRVVEAALRVTARAAKGR